MKNFIEKETEKAYLVRIKVENVILEKERIEKIWIPKSVIEEINGKIKIAAWFIQKNIIRYAGDMFLGFVD